MLFQVLMQRLWDQPTHILTAEAFLLVLLAWRFLARWSLKLPPNAPPLYHEGRLFGSLRFTTSRAEYLAEGTRKSRDGQFSFWYGGNHVVVVSGETGRTSFQTSRNLDPAAGFAALFGAFLDLSEQTKDSMRKSMLVYKRCTYDDHMSTNLQHLVADSAAHMRGNADGGNDDVVVDLMKFMGPLLYQLTHRMAGVHDIAADPRRLRATWAIYALLEDSPYLDVLLPWLPTPSKLRKVWGYAKLHWTISGISQKRKAAGVKARKPDMLQMLIDNGTSNLWRSTTVIGALIAGVFNTAFSTVWNLCCLADNPEWLAKVRAEIEAVIAEHQISGTGSAADALGHLTLREWETKFPLLQSAATESIRFTMAGAVVRKNIGGGDLQIGDTGYVIPRGSLAVHATADTHMNEAIYPDAQKWDPRRFRQGGKAQGADVPHSYLGWGSGNHPCPARRFAELNLIVTTVFFIASYDFHLCDKAGSKTPSPVPAIIYNRMGAGLPDKEIYMRCQRRAT